MSGAIIQRGDVGFVFQVTILDQNGQAVDISKATAKYLVLRDPTGVVSTKAAAFVGTGTDGKLKYTTVADDIGISLPPTIAFSGLTQADGAPTTSRMKFPVGASTSDNTYNGMTVLVRSGALRGMSRVVSSYTHASKFATFSVPWPSVPETGIAIEVLSGAIDDGQAVGGWEMQWQVTLPTSAPFSTPIERFEVQEKLT